MLNKEFSIKSPREIAYEIEQKSPQEILAFLHTSTKASAQKVFFEFSDYVIVDVFPIITDDLFKKVFSKANTHKSARVKLRARR